MPSITLDMLTEALTAGGPSVIVSTTELAPAGGPESSVAPARYVDGKTATYAYETRFVDGEAVRVVMIDSKQSQLNRAESAIQQAIEDRSEPLVRTPHITVTYDRDGSTEAYTDLTLPHRAYDGHIRAGTIDGVDVTKTAVYRALRDAVPGNARALLEASPVTLVFGGWDATRKARQGRWRSALVGEIVGVVTERDGDRGRPAMRGGARVDPVAMQVQLGPAAMTEIAEGQRDELSQKLFDKIIKETKKKGDVTSGSLLGLGGIPPTLEQLAGVACSRIIRTHVLSLATLRQLRFGAGPEGDAACRALLAALALDGLARSDAELFLRANCDLVEAGPTRVAVDRRGGVQDAVDGLGIREADALLSAAIEAAQREAGIRWDGQTIDVVGNPLVIASAVDESQGE